MSWISCWKDGPRDERDIGSTCMLAEGHDGPHVFSPDDQIVVEFPDPEDMFAED